jgi:hypothetical protein
VKLQCVVGNILIDKQPLGFRNAIAEQRHDMFMMYSADNINLNLELTFSLATSNYQLLYSNLFVRQQ